MRKLVIFGAKAFAEISHYYFTHDSDYTVVAFTVDAAFLKEPLYCGLPIVAFEELKNDFPPSECDIFVAIGVTDVNQQAQIRWLRWKQIGIIWQVC